MRCQRRIGQQQGKRSRGQQHHAAEGFDMEETFEGGKGAFGKALRARQGLPGRGSGHGRAISAWRPDHRINLLRRPMRYQHPHSF
ncbi:hypothetical protein GCM10007205_25500 [Oxalicibacterium flavum]|uniref:Uncharacterized protein n=1 Tax=Oxalicibacterium flavum TaxID=179467 RepID=A0A8J2UNS9_9BURK|nr:hypothetical protein GCM10007205_25500 [Oxalicibacterium flavum]